MAKVREIEVKVNGTTKSSISPTKLGNKKQQKEQINTSKQDYIAKSNVSLLV